MTGEPLSRGVAGGDAVADRLVPLFGRREVEGERSHSIVIRRGHCLLECGGNAPMEALAPPRELLAVEDLTDHPVPEAIPLAFDRDDNVSAQRAFECS